MEIRPDIHFDTILQANVRFHWLHSSLTYFSVYSMTLSHSLFIFFLTRDRTEEDINFGVGRCWHVFCRVMDSLDSIDPSIFWQRHNLQSRQTMILLLALSDSLLSNLCQRCFFQWQVPVFRLVLFNVFIPMPWMREFSSKVFTDEVKVAFMFWHVPEMVFHWVHCMLHKN